MPTYKGNVGNLMQHWTLCELLDIAQQRGVPGLNFIDAHAMAPLAQTRTDADGRFDRVRVNLPGQGSVYENAWHILRQQHDRDGYPSSAAFVRQVWGQNYSLLLCENNRATADEISRWLRPGEGNLCRGDWRKRFEQPQGLPSPADVGLCPEALTLASFDPYLISWHHRPMNRNPRQSGTVYPEDLQLVRDRLAGFGGGVLLQLSTYGVNGDNTQGAVISSVNSVLVVGGFSLAAVVVIPKQGNNGFHAHMMSLVYASGLDAKWIAQLANLPDRFATWFRDATVAQPVGA